ncbi:hypothetical protein [Nostoc sp. ChiQUE01b]|uniref:hypothetical protein n=1 Tax=Nostoc sp. ChiQUE01b TaxID=3075376 RepID=UPI002AD4FC5B|nr:hypothetical protein [Nostoc sp. ChiQUE01b]MDZ8258545.1 hypothetical protein [Nostoc sp. ChiQUE01b]
MTLKVAENGTQASTTVDQNKLIGAIAAFKKKDVLYITPSNICLLVSAFLLPRHEKNMNNTQSLVFMYTFISQQCEEYAKMSI